METHYSHCIHTGDRWTSVHPQSIAIRPRAAFLYQRQTLPHTTSAKSSNKAQETSLQLITRESPDSNNPKLKGKPDFYHQCCSSPCVRQGLLQTRNHGFSQPQQWPAPFTVWACSTIINIFWSTRPFLCTPFKHPRNKIGFWMQTPAS